jgi:hypothetical protein
VTDNDGPVFVTVCPRCSRMTRFAIPAQPETRAELEALRRRVRDLCPEHGETSQEELRERVERGEFIIAPPVAAELAKEVAREIRAGGGRAS